MIDSSKMFSRFGATFLLQTVSFETDALLLRDNRGSKKWRLGFIATPRSLKPFGCGLDCPVRY